MTSWPPIFTVEDPSVVSDAKPVFGYGIGTPGGVAGVCGGVKHTSGKAQMDLPSAALHESLHAVGEDFAGHEANV
jgi:hypothetical protein